LAGRRWVSYGGGRWNSTARGIDAKSRGFEPCTGHIPFAPKLVQFASPVGVPGPDMRKGLLVWLGVNGRSGPRGKA